MLLLADRNFPGWELWGLAAGTSADLAWRIKKNLVFAPMQVLPDESSLSVMPTGHRATSSIQTSKSSGLTASGACVMIPSSWVVCSCMMCWISVP
jgi:hypothetical protein